jgi:large repetitive protein
MTALRGIARASAAALVTLAVLSFGCEGVAAAAAPVIAIAHPASGISTNDQTPLFSGTTSDTLDPVTLDVYAGPSAIGTLVQERTLLAPVEVDPSEATWELAPEVPLAPGQYTAVARQINASLEAGESAPVTFTVDTTPPAVTINAVASPTNNPTPKLSGGAGVEAGDEPTIVVTVYEGTTVGGTIAVPAGSVPRVGAAWSYTTPHLSDGTYTAQASQRDEAGNLGKSAPMTFTVDTTPPVVSIETLHSPTNNAEPTLTGTASDEAVDEPNVYVEVHRGGNVGGALAAAESVPATGAAWSYAVGHLADGTYTAQAFQRDKAGNTGESATMTFTIDTTPPKVLIETPPDGKILPVSRPVFSGLAGEEAGDHPLVTLSIYADEEGTEKLAQTLKLEPVGATWTTGASGPILPDGIYTAVAEQSDEAGNVGRSSTTFTIYTSTPEPTLDTSAFVVRGGELVSGPTPSFSGTGATAPEDSTSVLVNVYSGSSTSGDPVRTVEAALAGSAWTASSVPALPDGTYTVQVEQKSSGHAGAGVSRSTTFIVDADPPQVTLTAPVSGGSAISTSQTLGGAAGTAAGDLPTITVHLYSGSSATGLPLQSVAVPAADGSWLATFGGLSPGTYTAQAEQSDDVGNIGVSVPTTFTLTEPPPPTTPSVSPPAASFRWVPSTPHPGEPVTLVSTSTDASSPITAFAWALAGNWVFSGGEAAITTSFATAGPHVVQLQVTDANGLVSSVAETIAVSAPAPSLIQPFPIVRMAGSYNSTGAKISLLTVQAPSGATVVVKCRGIGCPVRSEKVVVASGAKSKPGNVLITLRRFERPLRAGAVLVIEVSDGAEIGKYTRFVIHHGKLPSRQDLCLSPGATTPIQCPS